MPFFATSGAFSTFKSSIISGNNTRAYWFEYYVPFANSTGQPELSFNNTVICGNTLLLTGSYTTSGPKVPMLVAQNNPNLEVANITSTTYYAPNGTNTNMNNYQGNTVSFDIDVPNSKVYICSQQSVNVSNGLANRSVTRVYDFNGNLSNTYVFANVTNPVKPDDISFIPSDGSYTISGRYRLTSPANFIGYISSYNGNTVNWTYTYRLATTANYTGPMLHEIDSTGNIIYQIPTYTDSLPGAIAKLTSNGANIIWSSAFYFTSGNTIIANCPTNTLLLDNNDYSYSTGNCSNLNISFMFSANTSSGPGNLQWIKQSNVLSSNGIDIITSSLIPNNKEIIIGGKNTTNNEIYIASIYTANGNIKWQNKLAFSGTNLFYITNNAVYINGINTDSKNMYISGNIGPGPIATKVNGWTIKLPLNGTILGNGNYNLLSNATYGTLNLTYSTANLDWNTSNNFTMDINSTFTRQSNIIVSISNATTGSNTTINGTIFGSNIV